MVSLRIIKASVFLLGFSMIVLPVFAQTVPTPLQCGQVMSAEATERFGEQEYAISLAPGDTLNVSSETIGDYLRLSLYVIAPTTGVIAASYGSNYQYHSGWGPQYNTDTASFETSILSERGTYRLVVRANSTGLYTLFVGCTLRDGTVIAPGDVLPETQPVAPTTVTSELPSDFVGFRGLAPVDFSSVNPFSIPANVPMTGGVTPTGGEILGYLISGNEGDVLEIQFTRLSGNLNLGLVVLSQNNDLAFQASLITTNSLTTQLTLPSTGDYTVGVFRVDLLPPDDPESTTFQIQTVVNP